jgi:NaMN:DMB phosphoribosyltransferase
MNMRENNSRSKEVLGAYFRQGLKELGAALYPPGTVAQHAEYGMAGTRTPGEVADGLNGVDRKSASASRDGQTPSVLDQHIEQARERAATEREPEREDRHVERD